MSAIGEYEFHYAEEVITSNPPFYGVLAILIMRADTTNLVKLMEVFPDEVAYVRGMRNGNRDSRHHSYPSVSGPDIVPRSSGNGGGKMVSSVTESDDEWDEQFDGPK